jgi:hypothetical protein
VNTHTNPKKTCILLPFILVYSWIVLLYLQVHFCFTNMKQLCAWQPHGGVGNTRQRLGFVGCLKRKKSKRHISTNSLRVRYKPSSYPCWGNTLATTLCTWNPNKLVHMELLPSNIHKIRCSFERPIDENASQFRHTG